jgi:malonyl CoA-acyl carrier protein transacylase
MLAKSMQANNKDAADAYEAHIAEMNRMIVDLQTALAAEQCVVAGTQAQLAAMEVENKDSRYLKPTAMTFADGELKTIGRAVFEIYFDRKAEEIGLIDPKKYRRA